MSITKLTLKSGTKLKIKKSHESLGADSEIEVCFAGDSQVVVRTKDGKEITTDYAALNAMYEVVPEIIPTKDNFLDRLKGEVELMIAHLAAFNAYQQHGGVDQNMLAIGTKLHTIKEEVTGYVGTTLAVPSSLQGLVSKAS
jgi:hypothetical protein